MLHSCLTPPLAPRDCRSWAVGGVHGGGRAPVSGPATACCTRTPHAAEPLAGFAWAEPVLVGAKMEQLLAHPPGFRHCQKNGCWQHASRNRPKPGGCVFFASVISSHAELSRPRESRRVRVRRPASAEPRATTGRRHAAPSCVWSLRSSPQLPGPPGARALRCSLKVGPPWGQAPVCARRGLRGLAGV